MGVANFSYAPFYVFIKEYLIFMTCDIVNSV